MGFGFVTRGNTECSGKPAWFASGPAAEFFKYLFQMNGWNILTNFEAWAIARDSSMYLLPFV